jgi:hypothetical protein
MRTIETEAYTFDELSDDIKQEVIKNFREDKYLDFNIDYFVEDCIYQLEELGFVKPEIQYSLGYCQGDGLSFEADAYKKLKELYLQELGKGKERTAQLLADNSTFICTGNKGRYCFASTSDIDLYIENYSTGINTDNINDVVHIVRGVLEDLYIDICNNLEKQGYDEIEYQLSDECIIEDIQCNEYEFTKIGEQI